MGERPIDNVSTHQASFCIIMDVWDNVSVYRLVNSAAGIMEINDIESVFSGNSERDEDRTLNKHMNIMQNNRYYRQRESQKKYKQ